MRLSLLPLPRPAGACSRTPFSSLPLCRTYHARKNANEGKGDIVFNQLAYVPTCTHMPVCSPTCEAPIFMWKKKAAH